MSNQLENAYMQDYANSFFPPDAALEDLPELVPMRAGAMDAEMTAIEQTGLQKVMEQTGLTLEQIGMGLESLGSVNIGGFEISLRDILPFVGSSEKKIDPVTGEETVVQTGTPAALQQLGQGVSATTGTGFARQLRPDMKAAAIDVVDLVGAGKAITSGAKATAKVLAPKAAEMAEDFLTKRGMLLPFGPDGKQVEIPAAPKLETPAFKNWFSDSKVVDDQGKPLVVYHGTNKSEDGQAFSSFDTYGSNYGLMGQGSYFTREPNIASDYTKKGKGDSPTVYPVYLSIKNPIDMDAKANPKEWLEKFPDAKSYHDGGDTNQSWYRAAEEAMMDNQIPAYEGAEAMQEGLRSMGYDGIKHIGGDRVDKDGIRHQVYIAFDPQQIKSVFNKGTWNPDDPRISYGVGAGGAGAASQQEDK
jgi:hypothetical protein